MPSWARLQSLGFAPIDDLVLVDDETLEQLDHFDRPARLMVAGYLGPTRLIDNLSL
ncbi:MAG: hypothetical protein P4M00_09270 [Azospirillaceae bacterium]|nr:hypothetical protein [Azospirillaceae bacterium]